MSIYATRWEIGFHYSANIAPLLGFGLIYGVSNILEFLRKKGIRISKRQLYNYISIMIIIVSVGITFSENTFLSWLWNKELRLNTIGQKNIAEIIKIIPKDASLTAQSALVPHLSQREKIYFYPNGVDIAEYILVSKEVEAYPYIETELTEEIKKMRINTDFKLILQVDETYLFQRIN